MSHYLNLLEPEDVRFLVDFAELKTLVKDMLGKYSDLVSVEINYTRMEDPYQVMVIRPLVRLTETRELLEADYRTLLESGFSIHDEDHGDYVFEQIFGRNYTVTAATHDEDGAFFTIEIPFRDYLQLREFPH